MRVLTEERLRVELKEKEIKEYSVSKDTLITPSARQFLNDNQIELVVGEKKSEDQVIQNKVGGDQKDKGFNPKYMSLYSGAYFEKKPEYMTQLHGNKLVYKDDPRILFRGEIDSLESQILELQILAKQEKLEGLLVELEDILECVRNILRAEVLEEELEEIKLLGLGSDELREQSHHPKKYFEIDHILPNYKMGSVAIALNSLRSSVREVELSAVKAFRTDLKVERLDILETLNRLSSAVYIMICKYLTGLYS